MISAFIRHYVFCKNHNRSHNDIRLKATIKASALHLTNTDDEATAPSFVGGVCQLPVGFLLPLQTSEMLCTDSPTWNSVQGDDS